MFFFFPLLLQLLFFFALDSFPGSSLLSRE